MGLRGVGTWSSWVPGECPSLIWLMSSALRKTAYLLTALSSSIPHPPKNSTPLITYHPLDLSFPELHRVLREMDEAFGEQLKGKVDCIGLHGDYEAGLQFIRDGKLATLREVTETPDLPLEGVPYGTSDSILPKAILQPATPLSGSEACPTSSPTTDALIAPGPEMSPLPSAITDDDSSEFRTGSGRSWSPVEGDVPEPFYTWNAPPESEDSRPLHLVFLGSSLGNFPRETAAPFLRSLPLRSGDTLLLGLDGRPAPGIAGRRKVEIAYNDPAGHTRAFEEHGWDVVRESLGLRGDAGVEFVGRYNEELGELAQQRIDNCLYGQAGMRHTSGQRSGKHCISLRLVPTSPSKRASC